MMKSQIDSAMQNLHQPASRIQQLIILNLLTFLFFNIFCVQTLFAFSENKLLQETEQTHYSPTPIPNAIFLLNFSYTLAPTVVTERIVTSEVSVAERRQHVAWYAESLTNRGIRYRSGSASIENGFDCSGFVHYVMTYFDIKSKRSSSDMYNDGVQIPVESAKTGDLVFFGYKNDISHVAVVASNDENGLVIIHSCSSGIMKENVTKSKYWKSKLLNKAVNLIGF
jgi:cell wall-associated NlpC family hydrolase